jgi:hypothetical protein
MRTHSQFVGEIGQAALCACKDYLVFFFSVTISDATPYFTELNTFVEQSSQHPFYCVLRRKSPVTLWTLYFTYEHFVVRIILFGALGRSYVSVHPLGSFQAPNRVWGCKSHHMHPQGLFVILLMYSSVGCSAAPK